MNCTSLFKSMSLAKTTAARNSSRVYAASSQISYSKFKAASIAHYSKSSATSSSQAVNEAPQSAQDNTENPAPSFISSLLYGKKNFDDLQDVKNKLFAREKYEHEYVELYPKLAQDYYPRMKLTGSWTALVGDLDTAIHIWEYSGYDEMETIWKEKTTNKDIAKIEAEIVTLLSSRKNQLVQEFEFCPTSPPIATDGIYELRSYNIYPGKFLEWQGKWFQSLGNRSNLSSLKGAWYSKEGTLNQVHHLWAYKSLLERKNLRKGAWKDDNWSRSVTATMPLLQKMDSVILKPFDFSPLR
ncbi:Protein NipSnap-like protein [Smittium culicis]|uniref:Protein NipSnap-like protein n=1 Tax=Smittium culicis TaxID=133412 RepID=A0A1R1YPU9_9FUNG|nr:Protein NipSnap-like protein [Smittium culicis]